MSDKCFTSAQEGNLFDLAQTQHIQHYSQVCGPENKAGPIYNIYAVWLSVEYNLDSRCRPQRDWIPLAAGRWSRWRWGETAAHILDLLINMLKHEAVASLCWLQGSCEYSELWLQLTSSLPRAWSCIWCWALATPIWQSSQQQLLILNVNPFFLEYFDCSNTGSAS